MVQLNEDGTPYLQGSQTQGCCVGKTMSPTDAKATTQSADRCGGSRPSHLLPGQGTSLLSPNLLIFKKKRKKSQTKKKEKEGESEQGGKLRKSDEINNFLTLLPKLEVSMKATRPTCMPPPATPAPCHHPLRARGCHTSFCLEADAGCQNELCGSSACCSGHSWSLGCTGGTPRSGWNLHTCQPLHPPH